MAKEARTYTGSGSTTWVWKTSRVATAPKAQQHGHPKGGLRALRERAARDPLTITVKYRGGAECWWEIKARGETVRVPGYIAVHDVLMALNGHRPMQ